MPIVEIRRLSFDEEATLVQRAKKDPKAESELVNQYLPMFFSIAKSYVDLRSGRSRFRELPEIPDIVQEAYTPFKRAIEDYDVSRGYRFITLAQRYIRQHLDNKIKEERTKGRALHIKTIDEETGEDKSVAIDPVSLETPTGHTESGDEPRRLWQAIQEEISAQPEWQTHYDLLVQDVEDRLDSPIKKNVFRKLIEYGVNPPPKRLKEIREELGLGSSALSNILGRDIYPAVREAIEGT